MISGIVDRIEGKTAFIVTESKEVINLPSDGLREGDSVTLSEEPSGYVIRYVGGRDADRHAEIRSHFEKIIKNKNSDKKI